MKKFFLAFLLLCLTPLVQAQLVPQEGFEEFDDLEAIEIKSTTLRSVNVSFIGPKESGKLKGVVVAPSPLRRAKTLILEIVDPNGAVLVSEEIQGKDHWGRVLRQHEFQLDVPENGLAEGSVFEVSVYSGSQLVAFGERELPKLARPPSYTVRDLETAVQNEKLVVSFAFTNTTFETVQMVPKLELKALSNFNIKPKTSFLAGAAIGPKSEKVLTYEVDVPADTGLYEASISPLTTDKRLMAGSLKSTVVVGEGFGMISKFRLEPLLDNDTHNYRLILEGVSDQNLGQVDLALKASQRGDEVNNRISENKAFQSSVDGFSIEVPLLLENTASVLDGEVRVTSKDRLLSARKFSFDVDQINELGETVKPVEVAPEVREEGLSKWFLAVVLVVIVIILILFIWFAWRLYRKKNNRNLLILILSLTMWQSVWAEALENFWYHPLPGWAYNPTATGPFTTFNLIHFRGNIFNSLTQKGFFQVTPTRIVVKFFQDDGTRLYAESFDYEIDQKKIYKFDLSVPEGLGEGDWGLQIYFLMDGTWYVTTWTDESSGLDNQIKIDNTPPVVSEVEFDGQSYLPAERLVRPGIDTLKTARQTLLVDRSRKVQDVKQSQLSVSAKVKLRRDKIHQRNFKIDRIKDRELQLANLSPTADAAPIQAQIDALVIEVNTLTSQINGLTNELGQNIPPNSLFSTDDLDSDVDLNQVQNGPPGTLPATFSCPISAGSTPFNAIHLANCLNSLDTAITTLAGQIQNQDDQIRLSTDRFKQTSIGVNLICDDVDSGCYAACNPADEICDVNCTENPAACALYQTNSPLDYADNCSGDPLICEVDCVQDPGVCRRGSFDFSVRGNFCDDDTYCDTTAPKDFEVCDNVGNCSILTDSGVETDWYDPVEPELTESRLIRNKGNIEGTETSIDGQGSGDALAADERITFDITAEDPVKPTAAEYPALFDENACGFGANDDFFHADGADDHCSQSNVACALSSNVRGSLNQRIGGSCSGVCPDGFLLDVNNFCVPQCDFRLFDGCFPFLLIGDTCETSIWLPLETTVPIGQSFIQTSNCGETRTAIGTKPLTESLKHFLDGKNAFGVFFYDTFTDDIGFSRMEYSPNFDLGTAGYGGETSSASVEATFSHESGFSPAGGNVLKIESQNLQGGHAAWGIDGINVTPNTDYIFTYWIKTNASINKNEDGAWVKITGNGSSTDIFSQYSSTMVGVDSDMLWHRVELPFTTPSGTTLIDIELRLDGQNNRSVFFDDLKLFEENWRYDSSKSWYTEPLDDQGDGICDYMLGDSDGDPRGGLDDRCGQQAFPEKVVVAFTDDGLYVFDVIEGTLWMSARQDPNPTNWGRLIFNSLLFGDSYGLNGKLYSTFRFAQGGGKNGAVIVGDFIADTIYSHRMSSCFTLAGYKGVGSSYTTYQPAGCSQNAYNWSGYVNADQASRNSPDYPWSTVMPANLQTATNQLNSMHARTIGGVTYVAVATNFGVTVLNKTNDTNQHIEFDGHDSSNYVWSHTPNTANFYRKVYIAEDGKLYYMWDYSQDTRTRVWVIDNVSSLPFDSTIISGNSVWDYAIQPNNASASYPVTALSDVGEALDVNTAQDEFLIGSDVGAERFKGTFSSAAQHPNLSKSRVTRLFAGASLYGQIVAHWGSGLQDVGGKANDLTLSGSVTVSAVAPGADLQQLNFDETGYLFTSDPDFNITGPLTIGAWIKTEAGIDDGGYILAKRDASNVDFALYRDANNELRVDGVATTTITGLELEGWNFVAATWDGANKKIYIDGQLMSVTADATTDFNSVGELRLGNRVGGGATGSTSLNGSIALPFVINDDYSGAQLRTVYNSTRDWFDEDTQITLQGTSDNVVDVAYGDNGSYFIATSAGVTHFDLTGRVIRTINSSPTTATNVQIVTNDINSISYRNGWLILAYNGRGIEIVNVTRDGKESLPYYDNSIFDPYYFY